MPPVNRIAHLLNTEAMPRRKRVEKTQLGTYIPVDLHEAVQDFSDASGIPITRIVEDSLRDYLRKHYWNDEGDDE